MPNPTQPMNEEELLDKVRDITGGKLAEILRERDIVPTIGETNWSTRVMNEDLVKLILADRDAAVREAELKAALSVRTDYLFMMNTHDFGRPFTYEMVLQVTKDAYKELEDDLAALQSQPNAKEEN